MDYKGDKEKEMRKESRKINDGIENAKKEKKEQALRMVKVETGNRQGLYYQIEVQGIKKIKQKMEKEINEEINVEKWKAYFMTLLERGGGD